ncbi:MAG: hypothetical protein OMM_06055 [Candidatus Magnetoglobus multicellularis str. Araruama]|uniref:Uncharacterized protein n=1 Tax=Candidatus Magnetoglobus multicellularis str. Araruama TaxID=890399 RepID=A0A1V1NS42_9BACT|nr:MAG: hypothetical protein OMM_06055 [Candidatus Magnetoglobus multicellularis str. Araruama]
MDSQDNIVLSKSKNEKFVCGFPLGKYYLKLRLQGNEAVSYNIQYQLQPENSFAYLTVINNGQGDVFINGEHGLTNSFQMPFPKGSEIQLKGEPHDSGRILKWHTDSLESQINPALLVLDQHTIVYADFVAYSNNFQRVTKGIFDGYINENLYDSKENKIQTIKRLLAIM